MEELNERRKRILFAVISEYVSTADPVGSRTISKRYELDLSPATIRNVMSDLEDMGYFVQPHTSSGRVPTDKAFRLYIEELAQFNPVDPSLERELRSRTHNIEDLRALVTETSRVLSDMTQYAGIGYTPPMHQATFKHIQFIRLARRQLLVVLVSDSNLIQNRVVNIDRECSQSELDRMSNYLNGMLAGLTLDDCRKRLLEEIKDVRAQYDEVLSRAAQMGFNLIADAEGQVIIEGTSKMLSEPEFGDLERARSLFHAFEEKSTMIKLLDKAIGSPGVHIWMGRENDDDALENCAIVTGTYGLGGKLLGSIGVIGPMRMDYSRVVPLVELTSNLITLQLAVFSGKSDAEK